MKKSALSLPASLLLIGVGYFLASLTRKRSKQNEQEEQDPHGQPFEPFNSNAGKRIEPDIAAKYTKAFREKYPKNTTFANYCGRPAIEEILKNKACAGLRIYRAIEYKGEDGIIKGRHGIVVVGVTEKGKDIIKAQSFIQQFAMAESYDKCESNCDRDSILQKG